MEQAFTESELATVDQVVDLVLRARELAELDPTFEPPSLFEIAASVTKGGPLNTHFLAVLERRLELALAKVGIRGEA